MVSFASSLHSSRAYAYVTLLLTTSATQDRVAARSEFYIQYDSHFASYTWDVANHLTRGMICSPETKALAIVVIQLREPDTQHWQLYSPIRSRPEIWQVWIQLSFLQVYGATGSLVRGLYDVTKAGASSSCLLPVNSEPKSCT